MILASNRSVSEYWIVLHPANMVSNNRLMQIDIVLTLYFFMCSILGEVQWQQDLEYDIVASAGILFPFH